MTKLSLVFVLSAFLASCASNSIEEIKDPKLREILSRPVQEIDVKGLGKVKIGDMLTHRAAGKGLVRGLYINNGIHWVAFLQNDVVVIVHLTHDYFEPLN